MPPGLLLIHKPAGITSFDIIRQLRKKFGIKKMGHAGTLDRFASGLVLLAIGEATKTLSELILSDKEYIADIHFGVTSTTDDPEGEKNPTAKVTPFSREDFTKILPEFIGKIRQVPPQYSALKVAGKRASDRMRKGEDMEGEMRKKAREVEIYSLKISDFQFPISTIEVHCSSGTYIRSLARDLGKRMECGAYLENLKRTKIWNFKLAAAHGLEEITENSILPLQPEFFPFSSMEVSEEEEREVRFGRGIRKEPGAGNRESGRVSLWRGGRMVGFGEVQKKGGEYVIQPRKLLNP